MINFHNVDCMEYMKTIPDGFFDLAIVDPPYGIGRFGSRIDKSGKINTWDNAPKKEYFNQLFRISKNQIIWGANNFNLPTSEYFIIWDKAQTVKNFASAEYAWTNIKQPAQIFKYSIHKHNQSNKIHPTQKPVQLYKWLLLNYAKQGDKILDTHGGSGSIAIACHDLNFDLDICELDKEYFGAALKRFKQHTAQQKLF